MLLKFHGGAFPEGHASGKLRLHLPSEAIWAVATGLMYFFAAWLALRTASVGIAQFWPASGLAVAALILLGKSSRLSVAGGVASASVLANWLAGQSIPASVAFALGNAGEALLVAALIERWFPGPFELDRLRNVLGLFAAAALSTAACQALTAVMLELVSANTSPFVVVWGWLVRSNLTGIVLAAPLLLALAAAVNNPPSRRELFEGSAVLLLHALASVHAVGVLTAGFGQWMVVAPFSSQLPLLLWLAVRCGPFFAAAGSLALGLSALASFELERGRFADVAFSATDRLFATDFAMLATAFVALAIAALIAERKSAEQRREERLRFVTERAEVGYWEWEIGPDRLDWSPQCKQLFGIPPEEPMSYARFLAAVHPEDRERTDIAVRACLESGGAQAYDIELRTLWPDGTVRWIQAKGSAAFEGSRPLRMAGIALDISSRKRQEARVHLLLREVNHRAKNLLGVVQAIASQTAATGRDHFIAQFSERLQALAANQDLLVKSQWQGVELPALVRSQLAPFEGLIGNRITLSGPPLFIAAEAAQPIAMALHELATNAGKYGSLSNGAGKASITWKIEHDGEASRFLMNWRESSGPEVAPPSRRGFGTTVILVMPKMQLEADVQLDYAPEGISWRLACAPEKVLAVQATAQIGRTAGAGYRWGDGI